MDANSNIDDLRRIWITNDLSYLEYYWLYLMQIVTANYLSTGNLLVHLNSCVARLWIALFFKWAGLSQRGPLLVSPRLRSQSANQAMWQLQLNGLEMRLSEVMLVSSSKAPGVTQLIMLPYSDKDCRLLRPRNMALFTLVITFSESSLKEIMKEINEGTLEMINGSQF